MKRYVQPTSPTFVKALHKIINIKPQRLLITHLSLIKQTLADIFTAVTVIFANEVFLLHKGLHLINNYLRSSFN